MGQYDGVDLISSLPIGETEKAKILGGNARRLLGVAGQGRLS